MRFGLDLWHPDRWQFGREFTSLQRDMDRLIDQFTSQLVPSLRGNKNIDFVPQCDLEETSGQYVLSMDLPGMKKDELKIELTDNVLNISGDHKEEKNEERRQQKIIERYSGRFERSFTLPNISDASKVEAQFRDGVLRIIIPKAPSAKSKTIPVWEGKAPPRVAA